MAKITFYKKTKNFITKLDLHLKKKPLNCYILRIGPQGAENWTLWKLDHKYLERS
jgi:hypothetical protein